jgi:penicillin-binding protein 2
MAIMARKGKQVVPRIANVPPPTPEIEDITLKDDSNWDKMTAAMIDVVHGRKGTARSSGYRSKYKIAGKTGTAEVFSVPEDEEYNADELEERLRDHALFVAYAPAENPAIAIAVMVENGEHGSSAAAPVARAVMDAWLLNDAGELDIPAALELR